MVTIVILIIIGLVIIVLGCVNQRSLWRVTAAWRYRNPEAVEPSDAALMSSRIGLILVGLFVIVLPIIVTVSNNHDKRAAARAAVQASIGAAEGESYAQQEAKTETADVEKEGTKVLTAIVQHTPKGKSPRSVPLSDLPTWLPELADGEYHVNADASYATTGRLRLDGEIAKPLASLVCVTVPDHVVTSVQIASGSYVGTC